MGKRDGYNGRLEAATVCYILYSFGQGNFIFIKEKSGNFEKQCLWQPCMRSCTVLANPQLSFL